VPLRERLALNVESGLNDGLVVPVVVILTTIVLESGASTASAVRVVIEELGFGLAVGAAVGAAAILLFGRAHLADWSDGRYEQIGTFAVPIVAFFAADALNGSGFIAAFVAGLVFGALSDPSRAEHFDEFTEDAAQLLGIVAFFLFGNVFLGEGRGSFEATVWIAALAALTLVRIVPVWISQIGTGRLWPTRLFLGWFGPRGLASIVFGILLVEDAAELGTDVDDLLGVINVTVTASVVLHGATAAWGARTYGRWAARAKMPEAERADMFMEEMDASMAPPGRWSPRRYGGAPERADQTRT
jgi:NhaP-type Na+/H+ or K+/H+ antiporter